MTEVTDMVTAVGTALGAAGTIGGFAAAIAAVWQGFEKAHHDQEAALLQSQKELAQAQRDLLWRQTVEAQSAIRRMTADPQACHAMTMLDWNGRSFLIREDRPREHITWEEMRHALRAYPDRFGPKGSLRTRLF